MNIRSLSSPSAKNRYFSSQLNGMMITNIKAIPNLRITNRNSSWVKARTFASKTEILYSLHKPDIERAQSILKHLFDNIECKLITPASQTYKYTLSDGYPSLQCNALLNHIKPKIASIYSLKKHKANTRN